MRTVWVLHSCPAPCLPPALSPGLLYWNVHLALSIVPWRTRPELNSLTPAPPPIMWGILFRVSRHLNTKHGTSNDVTPPHHRSGGNCWWFLLGNRWKYYESRIFLKFLARQLCLNGRKDCNSIVTYYGFTILDLLREEGGDSRSWSWTRSGRSELFIDFGSCALLIAGSCKLFVI